MKTALSIRMCGAFDVTSPKNKRWIVVSCMAMVLGVGCEQWSEGQMAQVRNTAAPLFAALTRFKVDNGQYPSQLNQLVPEYIHEIPSATVGEEWEYWREDDGDGFQLSRRKGKSFYYYKSQYDKWTLDDGRF